MKMILNSVFFFLFPLISLSQQGIEIYGTYNQPIYNVYEKYFKGFIDNGGKIDIHNYGAGLSAQVYRNNYFSMRLGMGYKFSDMILRDEADSVNYIYSVLGSHGSHSEYKKTYYFLNDKPDFHNCSHSWSVNLDFRFLIKASHAHLHYIGGFVNYYFYEFYHSYYKRTEELQNILKDHGEYIEYPDGWGNARVLKLNTYLTRNFFTSAIDLQLYYQYNWNISDNFSLGVRASIGTNLYSDWKQFKKYVWAGFGLNIGFLKNEKVRLNKGELRK